MGSGGSDKAANEARRQEEKRQAAIAAGTKAVDRVFDAPTRVAQQQDFIDALRQHYRTDADRQKADADRKLRFSMARGGLTGGSAAADGSRNLGEEYAKGLLDAENKAQSAYADLVAQDEQSRQALLSQVRSGMDATTAASRAGAQMRANAGVASADAMATGLGDIFGNTAQLYKDQQEAAERRRGTRDAYGTIYKSSFS